ncbi:proto-oncogene tyrosine-protein kinase ROS-like [Formica exsecta]|uniref:proto-oncogene tyrosine-protein kinase ROS-like n=1 Tax=Formica exsecta TaxID=72781 RepID=UPI001142B198|nr:proto-oncogene tyrosine-protein kinase ROS-like [Formica exsecta]
MYRKLQRLWPSSAYLILFVCYTLSTDIVLSENNNYHILQNLKSDRSHPDSVSLKNKIDEISFTNMSVIPESIESILSKPTSPRAFVEFHNEFLNEDDDISVTSRWNQPEFIDEVIQGYTVQCWFIENQKEIQICNNESISAAILERTVHNLKPNTTYYFQVRAHTKVGAGPYTDLIDVSTTHENPIPRLLTILENGIDIWDLDSNTSVNLVKRLSRNNNVISAAYSIAEHKIYWSNVERKLMMLEINENNYTMKNITKITELQYLARNLCIDWIARNLYWMESDYISGFCDIVKLDLTMWENGIIKYDKISKIKTYLDIDRLTILPSIGTLYWTNYSTDNNWQIIQSDLDGKNARTFQNNSFIMSLLRFPLYTSNYLVDMKIDDMNTKEPLVYWLWHDFLFVTDINVSISNLILQTNNIMKNEVHKINFQSLTIDKTNIYISIALNKNIYVLKKEYALLTSKDAFKYIKIIRASSWINNLYAFGKSSQPYPPTRCLIPDKKVYNITILTETTNSIIVNLPEPVPKSGCKKYNLPTTLYTINIISYCLDKELNKFDNFTIQTYERYYEIQNLTPFTEYKLLLVTSNFCFDQLSMDPLFSSEMILKTKPDKFNAPENVTVQALTPTIAAVYWMSPKKLNCAFVMYKIYWTLITNSTRETRQSLIINKTEHKVDSKFSIIEPLIPGQKYRVYVSIYPGNFSEYYNNSLSKTLYMYSEPNNITLNEVSINGMIISWIPSVNLTIQYVLEYKNVEMLEWRNANNFEPINEGKVMYYIEDLLPGTRYEFRLILRYPKYEKDFTWPSDGRFTFSTLTSDISSTPGISVMQYYLPFTLSLVAIVICVCYFYYLYRQRKESNEQVLPSTMGDIELETLYEIPNVPYVQLNTLYSPMLEYNSDKYALTKIKYEDIRLGKLLGSGAFGMVYQGRVKNLEGPGTEISAAIKMLRKNASSKEKEKFLEEAMLMNHFRHKHVLRLLAVCLDGKDSPLIVLELMEMDLLQYLRDSRKLQPSDSHALRLQDLFAMCEDVARGCCYLENLRFVHRALEARNCLVSSRNRENRVIKIGDFALAKDISKNDYYRKIRKGLLPVRCMAPESLVVGIFTSQSNVWSFGVLMWEITSLGEQPYTGKTNLEMIYYVRIGGRLPKPLNCPPTLYELMLHCWNPANDRPNFNFCLKNIIALRNNIEDTLLNPVDIM